MSSPPLPSSSSPQHLGSLAPLPLCTLALLPGSRLPTGSGLSLFLDHGPWTMDSGLWTGSILPIKTARVFRDEILIQW